MIPNNTHLSLEDLILEEKLTHEFREFFNKKEFIEVFCQRNLNILSACETIQNITDYVIADVKYACKQTNQADFESIIMKHFPILKGVYCNTTSYRDEKDVSNPRHQRVFNMIEAEGLSKSGDAFNDLKETISEFIQYLGFPKPVEVQYEDMCKKYNVDTINADIEYKIYQDYGISVALCNFPYRAGVFFNMEESSTPGIYNKIDWLLGGMEVIGSASRSCDVDKQREMFLSIEKGYFSKTLFDKYGKERVEKELDEFLSLNFVPRWGFGCGINRLMDAYKLLKNI